MFTVHESTVRSRSYPKVHSHQALICHTARRMRMPMRWRAPLCLRWQAIVTRSRVSCPRHKESRKELLMSLLRCRVTDARWFLATGRDIHLHVRPGPAVGVKALDVIESDLLHRLLMRTSFCMDMVYIRDNTACRRMYAKN